MSVLLAERAPRDAHRLLHRPLRTRAALRGEAFAWSQNRTSSCLFCTSAREFRPYHTCDAEFCATHAQRACRRRQSATRFVQSSRAAGSAGARAASAADQRVRRLGFSAPLQRRPGSAACARCRRAIAPRRRECRWDGHRDSRVQSVAAGCGQEHDRLAVARRARRGRGQARRHSGSHSGRVGHTYRAVTIASRPHRMRSDRHARAAAVPAQRGGVVRCGRPADRRTNARFTGCVSRGIRGVGAQGARDGNPREERMREQFEFQSKGEGIRGHLFLPSGKPIAALVLTGPLTSVKEQASGAHARALAERGFAALAFDHRYFGESGGQPRQFENPRAKVEDIRAAAAALRESPRTRSLPLAAVGVCAGAGYMAAAVAEEPGFLAFAGIAGYYQAATAESIAASQARIERGQTAERQWRETGIAQTIPAVAPDGGDVGMPLREAYEFYGT